MPGEGRSAPVLGLTAQLNWRITPHPEAELAQAQLAQLAQLARRALQNPKGE